MFHRTKKPSSVAPRNIQQDTGAGAIPQTNSLEQPIPKISKTAYILDLMDIGFRAIAKVAKLSGKHIAGEPFKPPVTTIKVLKEIKELSILLNEEREEALKIIENINNNWQEVNNDLLEKYFQSNIKIQTLKHEKHVKNIYKIRVNQLKYENDVLKYQLEFAHAEMDFMQKKLSNNFKIKSNSPLSINH